MFSYVQNTLTEISVMLSQLENESNVPVEERSSLVNTLSVLRRTEKELDSLRRVELEENWPPQDKQPLSPCNNNQKNNKEDGKWNCELRHIPEKNSLMQQVGSLIVIPNTVHCHRTEAKASHHRQIELNGLICLFLLATGRLRGLNTTKSGVIVHSSRRNKGEIQPRPRSGLKPKGDTQCQNYPE